MQNFCLLRNKDALGYLARGVLLVFVAAWPLASCSMFQVDKPTVVFDPLAGTTEDGLRILRARLLAEQLADAWKIELPKGPQEFGSQVPATFVFANPFGRTFQLREPEQGFVVQLDWRIERWLPFAASEVVRQRQTATFDRLLEFSPDQEVRYSLDLPLGQGGESSAIWRVQLNAVLRCDGLDIDGESLPVSKISIRGGTVLVLPGNWQSLQSDPLAALEKLVKVVDPQVDRHLLVAAALLPAGQKSQAIELLATGLDAAPSLRRMDTMMAALRFLTGRDFGESPSLWKEWWGNLKIANRD